MHSHWFNAALSAVLFAGAVCVGTMVKAEGSAVSADRRVNEIVVRAKRWQPEPAADARLERQVESALASDVYFNSEHVSVTVLNGIATLHGIVFDDWDLRNAIRISRRIPGVRRVVNDLEIKFGGE